MNKIMTAFVALTAIFLFSCNSNTQKVITPVKKDFTFTAHVDTSITVQVPVTAPINLCAGGQSPYRKIKSFKDSVIYLSKGETITLTSDEMNSKGWYWFPAGVTPTLPSSDDGTISTTKTSSDNSSFNWIPDWLLNFIRFIFWVVLVVLILWGLYELGMWIRNNASRANRAAGQNTDQPGAGAAAAGNQNVSNPVQPPVVTQEVNLENSTTVVMPESKQRPLFVIKNAGDGGITVGNIHIHVDSDGDHNEKAEKPEAKPAVEEKKD